MDDWERLKEELLRDPATREAYEARKPAYRLAIGLVQLRAGLGLTQRQLASLAHMTQPEIARLESGTVQPTWETIARVLEALGAEVQVTARNAHGRLLRVPLLTGDSTPASRHALRRPRRSKGAAPPPEVTVRRDGGEGEAASNIREAKTA